MKHSDLFEFEEWASFYGPSPEKWAKGVTIGVDHLSGKLFFSVEDERIMEISLMNVESVSLYWIKEGPNPRIGIGKVNFDLPETNPRYFKPSIGLNQSENNFNFSLSVANDGWAGAIDIRDIGKVGTPKYTFDISLVPFDLSIVGSKLVVKTLMDMNQTELAPWYTS